MLVAGSGAGSGRWVMRGWRRNGWRSAAQVRVPSGVLRVESVRDVTVHLDAGWPVKGWLTQARVIGCSPLSLPSAFRSCCENVRNSKSVGNFGA